MKFEKVMVCVVLTCIFHISSVCCAVSGTVIDKNTHQPLADVEVELFDDEKVLTFKTGEDGRYTFFDEVSSLKNHISRKQPIQRPKYTSVVAQDGSVKFRNPGFTGKNAAVQISDLHGRTIKYDKIHVTEQFCQITFSETASNQVLLVRFPGEITRKSDLKTLLEVNSSYYLANFSKTGYETITLEMLTSGVEDTIRMNPTTGTDTTAFGWTPEECHPDDASLRLADLVNEYRVENGKDPIPLSATMFLVAHLHTRDLYHNSPHDPDMVPCNIHSWSDHSEQYDYSWLKDQYTWSGMCYTTSPDQSQKEAMWDKPKELTNGEYTGFAIENVAYTSGGTSSPDHYLNLWKGSPGHNNTMLNLDKYASVTWHAMGASIYNGYASVWFGSKPDNAHSFSRCP